MKDADAGGASVVSPNPNPVRVPAGIDTRSVARQDQETHEDGVSNSQNFCIVMVTI